MKKSTLSEIIFALEQIKDIHGDKEVCQLSLMSNSSEELLHVEFMDYETHTIEVKSNNVEE